MKLYIAPEQTPERIEACANIFLAGSIEQDRAMNWQQLVINEIEQHPSSRSLAVFNPRRQTWDASLEQTKENPAFNDQVNWELDHLWRADITFFYFEPGTKSPISLMELGFMCGRGCADMFPIIVVCPPGFWRRGNVEIMCERENIPCFDTLEAGLNCLNMTISDYVKVCTH